MKEIEKSVRVGKLIDFYGKLLTEQQKNIMTSFYYDDLSLTEIAEIHNCSRQAVFDIIKKCSNKLEQFETNVGAIKMLENANKALVELQNDNTEQAKKHLKQIVEND